MANAGQLEQRVALREDGLALDPVTCERTLK